MRLALATRPETELGPFERLELLCDPGSFQPIRSGVVSSRMGDRTERGDGVIAGAGRIAGRPVFAYAQDPGYAGGSLGEAQADSIVRVLGLARQAMAPVVSFVESGGARLQEGPAALGGYGRIFRESVALSGVVPQVSIVTGISAGGGSYSPALTDFVVMTQRARMFLTGPGVVRQALGEEVSMADLGGPRVHERNGVCQFVVNDDRGAVMLVRELLSLLPQNAGEAPPTAAPCPPDGGEPDACLPDDGRRVYDVRDVIRMVVDAGWLLEVSPRWARNMVTGLARIDGRPVGVIANQPWHLGGVLDAAASEKAAGFVRACDRFSLPLVVLVDTPGFMPGTRQEAAGVIRHGAALLHAFAGSTVTRLTVVLRKAYGGAAISMNSKDLGAHMAFAWRGAEVGIMAADQAVAIAHRRQLAATEDRGSLHARLSSAYAREHLAAEAAAACGYIDEVIAPGETRERLAWALASMEPR